MSLFAALILKKNSLSQFPQIYGTAKLKQITRIPHKVVEHVSRFNRQPLLCLYHEAIHSM